MAMMMSAAVPSHAAAASASCRAKGAGATLLPARVAGANRSGLVSFWVRGAARTSYGQGNAIRARGGGKLHAAGGRRLTLRVSARRGGRAINYETSEDFVLLAPGEDEEFLTKDELQDRLEEVLNNWDGALPEDLATYPTNVACAMYLVESVCELELGGGRGSYQWYNVRLS